MTNASAVAPAMPTTDQVKPLEPVGFWSGPFRARTWREFGYLFPMLVLSPITFTYVIVAVTLSAGTIFTVVVWLLLLGWFVVGARGFGAMYRGLARSSLRAPIATPPPFRRGSGFWGGGDQGRAERLDRLARAGLLASSASPSRSSPRR